VAIYVRISDDREGAGLGVARQEVDCRQRTEALGWVLVEVYVDNDLSAYSGKPRPAYRRMLADLEAGRVDAVLAWHTDRLHRSPRELEEFIDICERHGVVVESVKAGPLDLSTPAGRAVARTLGAWARYESEHKAERQRRKALELAQAGKDSGGGYRPYGYEADRLMVREAEAGIIRECARRVLAGEPIRSVARDFNARGIPTAAGKQWSAQTLKRTMVSGRISGQREHQPRPRSQASRKIAGEIVAPAAWPAIITPAETTRLRAILLDPSRRLTNIVPKRCLLTGILRCSYCGAGLLGRPNERGQMRYVCNKVPGNRCCGKTYVLADPADELVTEMVRIALDSPALLQALRTGTGYGDDASAHEQLSTVQRKLEELAEDYASDTITRGEWLAARKRLEARQDALRRRLATTSQTAALEGLYGDSGAFQMAWKNRSLHQRRAAIAAVLDRVVVKPAVRGRNKFDRDRFKPVWRV
jgi:DNA invertase Pin-like site-specific DNA recombinase